MSFRTLEIARSAMIAQKTNMEVIGHNVANIQTRGYTRRRVELSQVAGESSITGQISGLGVNASSINRMGDQLLAAQINNETGRLGYETTLAQGLATIENIVTGSSGRGLLDPLNKLFDAFAEVAASPGTLSARNNFVTAADTLSDSFQQISSGLQSELVTNDKQIEQTITQINELAREVAHLNQQIAAAGGANSALDLNDRRGAKLTQLAELVGAASIRQENGYVDVVIGGHHLVQGDIASQLELERTDLSGHPTLHTWSVKMQLDDTQVDISASSLGGNLAGLTEFHTLINDNVIELNEFATNVADQLNAVHATGYGLEVDDAETTPPDRPLFTYSSSSSDETAATFSLNAAINADPRLFKAASAPNETGNGNIALALEALRTDTTGSSASTLLEIHTDYLASLGSQVQLAQSRQDARIAVTEALEGRYQENAGVSLDEEALQLSQAEKAYSAAQRIAQAALAMIDEILDLA